ncbi:MAG: hypothetical protein IKK70_00895 [Clostridia bacterium]|nr:hypothetical protein [Clostridia bacterium]
MNAERYFKTCRAVLLSLLSFWAYFALTRAVMALCITIYADADTRFEGLHPSIYVLYWALCIILLVPYAFDCFVSDADATLEYTESLDRSEFNFKQELLSSVRSESFIATRVIWLLCSLVFKSFFFTVALLLITTACELFAHRRWFYCHQNGEEAKPKRRPYFFTLAGICARWILMVVALALIVAVLKNTLGSIWAIVSTAILIAIGAVLIFGVVLFIYRRIRAIRVQIRLISKLERASRENGYRFRKPNGIFSALLLQKPVYFTLEHRHSPKKCVVIPTLNRSHQLYFLGDGVVQRVKRYYFFKTELFYRSKYIEYKLPESEGMQNIVLLSPIPREFFIGPVGKPAVGDNASEIDGALIYSGTAFCNYLSRTTDRVYEKEIMH